MTKGCVHLYCGDGKGKTTAAMGLALRMLGRGRRVVIVQFLKDGSSGELEPLRRLGAEVLTAGITKFTFQMTEAEKAEAAELQTALLRRAAAMPADLLVLDEACAAVSTGLVDEAVLRETVLRRPEGQELVLTGRDPQPWMQEAADYITEMRGLRHPYEQGIPAREGVEY